jgi:mercuric ion transport protein
MKELAQQLTSMIGAGFAAACCLGITAALSVLTAVGAGFLINDIFLIPLYVVLLALSLWLLYRSARTHANLAPFWLGIVGTAAALAGLWISPIVVYAGLLLLVAGSLSDFFRAARQHQ